MKAYEAIDSAIWAMDEEWVRRLRAIAIGEGEGPEAVAARLGRPLQNAQMATVRDGVAIIPVVGPIFRYANMFTEISGATSIGVFARDLRAALDDQQVRAILLEINSPGGQVDGINEAAQMVFDADKPIAAYVSGMGTSAAYWIASAADHVVMDKTARVGSIGVVTAVNRDKAANDGVIEIVSSQSPNKRPDVNTPEGRATIQAQVDAIADVFVDTVARNRDVSRETVLSEFGQGGVKVGDAAIAADMADSAGSLESTLAQLSSGTWKKRRRMMPKSEDTAAITEADVKAAVEKARGEGHATGYSDGEKKGLDDGWKAGLDEGTKKERERLLAIDKITMKGHEALALEAKEAGMSPGDFAVKQAEAEKSTREKQLEAIKADGKQGAEVVATATGDPKPAAEDQNRPLDERAKAAWDADSNLRAEFQGEFDRYLAFRKNEPRIRILRKAAS